EPPDGDPSYFTSETQPLFIWSKVTGAEKFALEFASDPTFTTFFTNHCMTLDVGISFTSESYRPTSPLPVNTQIYWRIKTIDKAGNSTAIPATGPGIPYRRLYIDTVPPDGSYVQLTAPENFSLSSDYTPTFTWNWEHDAGGNPVGQAPVDSPDDGIEMDKAILEYHISSSPWPDASTVGSASSGRVAVESSRSSGSGWDSLFPGRLNTYTYTSAISLTPNSTYYWRVRPVDSAGNVGASSTIFRFDYGLTSDQLPAPIIKDPANGEIVTTQTLAVKVQTFPPALIPGQPVRTYSVKVYAIVHDMSTPGSNDIKLLAGPQSVPPGEDSVTLSVTLGSGDGPYTLIATVVDDAGSESNPSNSLPVRIILDRGHPKVSHLTITSNHEGSSSAPSDDISSKLLVQIVFSEPMMEKDTSNNQLHPDVYIYPEKGINSIKVEAMETPKKSWSETGDAWTGIATIPAGKGYDGQASVSIGGSITDLAGRRISPNPTYYPDYFVINTAPMLKVKAFYNPTDERDIIVSIESSEKLRMVPLVEIDFNGEVSTITTNLVHDMVYTGVFTIPSNRSGQVNIVAYGTDYAGNTGLDKYAFRVIEIDPYEGYNVTYPRDFYLKIASETIHERKSIVIIPRELETEEFSAKTSAIYKIENSSELVPVKKMAYDIGPYSLEFKKPVSIEFDISDVDSSKNMGIFNYRNGKWNYVPSFRIGDTLVGASRNTGIYAVMTDIREPRIISVNPEEGEKMSTDLNQIEIEFTEDGSGIDVTSIDFCIDDVRKSVHVEDNKIIYRPYSPLKSGEHQIKLSISDNLGNVSQKIKQKFYAPKAFEVHDFYFYPNPSDVTDPVIHYILTQNPTDVNIKIYDLADQLVTTIDSLPTTIGEHRSATWDRKNDDLDNVANGVYYAKIIAKNGSNNINEKIIKIVVLR
ncbi:hypothetical protein KAJ27_20165, partial [bacterium]|nr:hypothetical protein [bacterium]